MDYDQFRKRLVGDASLPMQPQVLAKVQQVVARADSSARELAEAILSDPGLTSRILKLVNSAYYGQAVQVTQITQAIVLLGFDKVRNLALGLSSFKVLNQLSGGRVVKEFWIHSLAAAVTSRALAVATKMPDAEVAFIGGLLHDVGKLILAHYFTEEYQEVMSKVSVGEEYLAAERAVFDMDHRDAGLALAETWRFPENVKSTIRYHHHLGKVADLPHPQEKLKNVVAVANLIAKNLYGRLAERKKITVEHIVEHAGELLSLNQVELDSVVISVGEEVDELADCLGVNIKYLKRFVQEGYSQATLHDVSDEALAAQEELHLERRKLNALNQLSSLIIGSLPLDQFFDRALSLICDAFGFDQAFFASVNSRVGRISGKIGRGHNSDGLTPKLLVSLSLDGGILARTVIENRPYNVHDVAGSEMRLLAEPRLESLFGTANVVTFPIVAARRVMAVLLLCRKEKERLTSEKDMETLQTIATQVGLAIERATWQKTMERPR